MFRRYSNTVRIIAATLFLSFMFLASAKVTVVEGPTPIPRGEASAAKDLTIMNNKIAVSIAVETSPPWGMPKGSIIDAAVIQDGKPLMDRLTVVDFLTDQWAEWVVIDADIKIIEQTDEQVVIQVDRVWRDATLVSTYTLKDNDDKVYLKTVMTNMGEKDMEDHFSGYAQWAKAGALKTPVGTEELQVGVKAVAKINKPGTSHTIAYDKDWAVALYAPFATHLNYEGKDMYQLHTLKAGESRTFEAWLQILPSGDISPALVAEATFEGKKLGTIKGSVKNSANELIEAPAVVVEQNGVIHTWAIGSDGYYELTLPVGDYELYATALNHSPSAKQKVKVNETNNKAVNFDKLAIPGMVVFKITDQQGTPLAGRMAIAEGVEQPIAFLGANTIFTEISPKGEFVTPLAPGDYKFSVTHAQYYLAPAKLVSTVVKPGETTELDISIALEADPRAKGWYNADLHHHSNLLDADTPPEFIVRSQTAAGVDLTFVSDHDTVGSHHEIAKFSNNADILFIPGLEISPSWGHFNVFPLPLGQGIDADPSTATVTELFDAARKAGAKAIVVNHPTIEYGYFTSRDRGTIPGGVFDKSFNLGEINSLEQFEKDIPMYWALWNEGQRFYLSGGTDNHNVWRNPSANMRAFVKVEGELSVDKFIDALLAGQAFISQGPLIYPETMFGSIIPEDKDYVLNFELESVMGLKDVKLIGNGEELEVRNFGDKTLAEKVSFKIKSPSKGQWFTLIVSDQGGRRAWSNPIWVE